MTDDEIVTVIVDESIMTPDNPQIPPKGWLDALDRGWSDVAAGRTHDFEAVLQQLEAKDAEDASTDRHGTSAAE